MEPERIRPLGSMIITHVGQSPIKTIKICRSSPTYIAECQALVKSFQAECAAAKARLNHGPRRPPAYLCPGLQDNFFPQVLTGKNRTEAQPRIFGTQNVGPMPEPFQGFVLPAMEGTLRPNNIPPAQPSTSGVAYNNKQPRFNMQDVHLDVSVKVEIIDPKDFIVDLEEFERDDAERKFKILQDMFPEACPDFLRAKCIEYSLNQESFEFFVENMMVPGAYPKKPNIFMEEPHNDEIPEFNLDSFLEKYPDPIKHFSRLANGSTYLMHSFNYLQMRYKFLSVTTIRMIMRNHNFNLYLSHVDLKTYKNTRKIPRKPGEVKAVIGNPPEDYYDQVLLIENEDEVKQYLEDKVIARNKAVEEARLANALLICGCCYADDLLPQEVSNCTEGHIFCKECILRSSEILMGEGKIDFPCLQECKGNFNNRILEGILPVKLYNKLQVKLQEREVKSASIEGLESCPFCEYCAIPPEEARIFECHNCRKKSCRLCRKESHVPFKCSEVKDENVQGRVFVEEKMTEALVRRCYRCNAQFIREDGCNKMTCVCGAKMCYICRKPIQGYSHFDERSHGTRPYDSKKCPLWTDNRLLHQREVNNMRDRAIEDLKRKNPDIDLKMFNKRR